ncbi:MAG UNVERIFIED_CONTAM: GNAT family N-acetyltransferase [Anaerolineae bacterium]
MLIRLARLDEAGDVAELWMQLVDYHRALDPDLPAPEPDGIQRYAKFILNLLRRDDARVYVLIDRRGRVAGYALGMIIDLVPEAFVQEKAGFIADVYIEPPMRTQGYGRALVEHLFNWFREHHLTLIECDVASKNTQGIAFWQHLSGRPIMTRLRFSPSPFSETDHGKP